MLDEITIIQCSQIQWIDIKYSLQAPPNVANTILDSLYHVIVLAKNRISVQIFQFLRYIRIIFDALKNLLHVYLSTVGYGDTVKKALFFDFKSWIPFFANNFFHVEINYKERCGQVDRLAEMKISHLVIWYLYQM